MVFSSITFLFYFLPLVLLTYFLVPRKARNSLLLIFSLVFYAWGEPKYIILMLISILINWLIGLGIDYTRKKGSGVNNSTDLNSLGIKNKKFRLDTLLLLLAVIINISLLGIFKYADFIINNINSLSFNPYKIENLHLALPIGISFYTFQIMSYVIDLYREDVQVEKNILNLACYVTMFPQLIAGPIVRFHTVSSELRNREESFYDIEGGIEKFVIGLGKKAILANSIGELWKEINAYPIANLTSPLAWLGIVAFAFQIYFDFSAYSDMAIGLGRIFGFHFEENFNYPYISQSVSEFWRRWHISLSTWFKEYVYIPLGGNRCSIIRQVFNLLIVWSLTGIWHGAAWNFLIWGAYFGIILIIEKFALLYLIKKMPKIIRHIYTLFIVLISWAIFAQDNFIRLREYLKVMFSLNTLHKIGTYAEGVNSTTATVREASADVLYYLSSYGLLLIILVLASTPLVKKYWEKVSKVDISMAKGEIRRRVIIKNLSLILIFLLSVASLVSATYNPFMYFRF